LRTGCHYLLLKTLVNVRLWDAQQKLTACIFTIPGPLFSTSRAKSYALSPIRARAKINSPPEKQIAIISRQ
jgi:hypothetical protein